MLFETLDVKEECVGIYADSRLIFEESSFPTDLSATWSPSQFSAPLPVEYASLYLEGKNPATIVPEYLADDWGDALSKLQSFERSFNIAGIDREEHCFYDLVPSRFLLDYYKVKSRLTQFVLDHVPRPSRYDFYHYLALMLLDIAQKPVMVDTRFLQSFPSQEPLGKYAEKILTAPRTVSYNQFGTRTGRLTTHPRSFPILTLPKALRSGVKCQNDYYVEIDFNGAEVRTLLGLLGKAQPPEDVHQFHIDSVFKEDLTREQAKVAFFAWLYGSRKGVGREAEQVLHNFYDKKKLLADHWKDQAVTTIYGKTIQDVTEHHALNYIIQSTAAELLLKQALKIHHLLNRRSAGSYIAFLIHDSVVLDFKKEDEALMESVIHLFSSTNFGKFGINIKQGTTLGNLK